MTQLWQIKKVESIFQTDRFDFQDYMDATASYPRLAQINDKASREYCGQPAQDAFLDLYKTDPRLTDPCPKALTPLRSLIERGQETPEYKQLKANSMGDLISSAVGAEVFVNKVMASLPDEVKEEVQKQAQAQQKADNAQERAEAANEFSDLMNELAGQAEAEGDTDKAGELKQQAKEAYQRGLEAQAQAEQLQTQADAAGQAAEQTIADHEAQIMAALNNAAGQAQEEAQETSTLVKSFSLAAGGEGEHVDPEQARQIMQLMRQNPNLQELADLIGWAKRMVRAEWRKSPHGHAQMTGYRKDQLTPSRMASSEMARMVSPSPAIKQDWQRRAVNGAIVHRQYEGEEQQARGDFAIVRDESGSMAGPEHATAIALEWALLEIARRDNRGFISIPFSGPGEYRVWRAPKQGEQDIDGLLAHLGHFYGGGTEPYAPLTKALQEIAHGEMKADILLLTDGSFAEPFDSFLQELAEVRQETPIKIVTVVIGGYSQGHVAEKFSDRVVYVGDLFADREKLREAVAEVV